ncbi:MAG: hypothetical protein OEU92_25325 [Alphaproteobacteria bacterium]|nr:hypothetical protein [Alphaproteobacteria bacterium]
MTIVKACSAPMIDPQIIRRTDSMCTMADDHEIWHSAQEMIDRYDDKALREITKRIQELDQAGKTEACQTWRKIWEAAKALLDASRQQKKH